MSSSVRSGPGASRPGVRQGSARPSTARHFASSTTSAASRIPDRAGAVSPADSMASALTSGTKRKERDFETDSAVGSIADATNINVVVRCRGRSSREVKENSAVVVNTDGVKGKLIELSMGANALSHKAYNFDRVFSAAADQSMVFDDTVRPILDEMLAGFNCTIFAYGQTGTGKTYTMSGDMTDTFGMLSDEAGIIPRVLQSLFRKLELDDTENCVKCSFIELYNEELRDLLSVDESVKLKIYDDVSRRSQSSTLVQGMEEKHIKNAAEGIKVLQDGSLKRQVAATKCNDLSSRSHTVFTVTAYVKKTNEHGVDDFVSAGKLNLVDLAGSENIQRSGAENKRAAEAGLINKSLLTLGRVINALVDRSPHVPYRESKLTRLLQDSLGGRTKTCIIATISPAKANMEETISTLDYAFRAKNIRNKPQLNAMLNKRTLLKDFTNEIERLKSELITTRQRNGVYLSNESYEEMTAQSESRRIVVEEQAGKIETLETNLRNKVQDLLSMTTSFMGVKKEHESTKAMLDNTQGVLDQTEIVLAATRKSLAEETELREAHAETEAKLTEIGGQLINKLHKTVHDVGGLHAKNKRKSDLQSLNRAAWGTSQAQVADVTSMVERRVQEFQDEQREHISSVSQRMDTFVQEELQKLSSTQAFLDEHLGVFEQSRKQLVEQKQKSKEDMDEVLEEIKVIRDSVKERVGESLQAISLAAEKIAADVVNEMTGFHSQLHNSYSTLGRDFKSIFEDLVKSITTQRSESDNLRRQLQTATGTIVSQNASISTRLQEAVEEERKQAAEERQKLATQIASLINSQAESQEARLAERAAQIQKSLGETGQSLDDAVSKYGEGMDLWDEKDGQLLDEVKRSRDQIKSRLKDDWNAANDRSTAIQGTARAVHAETTRTVEEQAADLETRMESLDDFVARAKTENAAHHESHTRSVAALSGAVEQSLGNIGAHFKTTFGRVQNLGDDMAVDTNDLAGALEPLDAQICGPLANLREGIAGASLLEYEPTGETPQKAQYVYPTDLPRTEAGRGRQLFDIADDNDDDKDDTDLEDAQGSNPSITAPLGAPPAAGPPPPASTNGDNNTTVVFADLEGTITSPPPDPTNTALSLREVNVNMTTGNIALDSVASKSIAGIVHPQEHTMPLFKRSTRRGAANVAAGSGLEKLQQQAKKHAATGEGRENVPLPTLAAAGGGGIGGGRRKSPRLN